MSGYQHAYDEVKERYEAQKIADATRSAVRAAEAADRLQRTRPREEPPEDEDGFVDLRNYRLPNTRWDPTDREVDGERWSWLHGEAG